MWWAAKWACLGSSTTILLRLVPFHPKISVTFYYAFLALSHQLSLLCMTLAGYFLPSLLLEPTPPDFGVHVETSRHTAVSEHLVDVLILGCIPMFGSAGVLHCKIVVCDNLFGSVAKLVRVGCCQWVWFDMISVQDMGLVLQLLTSSTVSILYCLYHPLYESVALWTQRETGDD